MNNESAIQDFMQGLASTKYDFSDEKYSDLDDDKLARYFTRTQDLGVWTWKYSTIPKFSQISEKWRVSSHYTTAKDDPIFGWIKFSEKCNYKPGLANSLVMFEHPLSFQIYKGLWLLTAKAANHNDEVEGISSVAENVRVKIEVLSKVLEEERDSEDYKHEFAIINDALNMFKAWHAIIEVTLKLITYKVQKLDKDKVNEELENNKDLFNQNLATASGALTNDSLWKAEAWEEVKFDFEDLESVSKAFKASFAYTNQGTKSCCFYSNYVLPMFSVALGQLSKAVSSLSPKKKKAGSSEALTSVLIQPWKELLKGYKEWVNSKLDLYTNKSTITAFHNFIEQVQEHSSILVGQFFSFLK